MRRRQSSGAQRLSQVSSFLNDSISLASNYTTTIASMTTITSLLATAAPFNTADEIVCLVFSVCECKSSICIYCMTVVENVWAFWCHRLVVKRSTRVFATELPVGANQWRQSRTLVISPPLSFFSRTVLITSLISKS